LRKRQADGHPHGHKISPCLSEDSGQIVPTTRLLQAGEKEGASRPLLDEKLAQTASLRRLLRTIRPRNRTIRTEPAVSEPAGRETPRGRNTHPLATTRSERASQVAGTGASKVASVPLATVSLRRRPRVPQVSIAVIPVTHRYPQRKWVSVDRGGQHHERKNESRAGLNFSSLVENSAHVLQAVRQAGR
jgi:hypothetical protein